MSRLAPLLRQSWERAAHLVAAAGPETAGTVVTQRDRDTALGIMAVHTFASVWAALGDEPTEAAGAADRLIRRLLAGRLDDGASG